MLEFAELKQNAMLLTSKLTRSNSQYMGCMGFFSALLPSAGSLNDSMIIEMIATSFDMDFEANLFFYLRACSNNTLVKPHEFTEFKNQALRGIYILVLSRYSSPMSAYVNKNFIELLQRDLGINSLTDLSDEVFHSSLTALSQYCSCLYENRNKDPMTTDLNNRLGPMIQGDIEAARNSRVITATSWYGDYCGMLCSLWTINKP
ncbi:hypothetical protein [Legionella worsleiensis]|uniref:Uncharacterized protein n=1 Tax=Legionella worsleiensis TaxID=45076 RepID=A0A0W1A4D0_9GAMM|nr:hypothetical protein [Legionella worsleiensis]KTD76150.1 hypothetical protein Lwor_2268 [Legionella worsleiensis]STY33274.1 Uncharacterised protein [Legionella worsleiensis]